MNKIKQLVKNKVTWIVLGVIGVISLAYIIMNQKVSDIYVQAEVAYHFNDEDLALEHYRSVSEYPNMFGDTVTKSQARIIELQTYIDAQKQWENGEYAKAIDQFNGFNESYADSEFVEESLSALKNIPFEWGDELASDEDYSSAIAMYKEIVANSDFSPEEIFKANNLIFEVYQHWGYAHYDLDEFSLAIEVFLEFGEWLEDQIEEEFRSNADLQNAQRITSDIFLDWAQTGSNSQDYSQTVEVYLTYEQWVEENEYQDSEDIQGALAQIYYEWGLEMVNLEDYEQAVEKFQLAIDAGGEEMISLAADEIANAYLAQADIFEDEGVDIQAGALYWALLNDFSDSDAASQVGENAYSTIVMWGHALFENGEFEESRILYEKMLELVNTEEQELLFIINFDLGQIAHDNEQYLDALNYYIDAAAFTGLLSKNEETLANAQQATLDIIKDNTGDLGQELIHMMIANAVGSINSDGDRCIDLTDTSETVCISEDMGELLTTITGSNKEDIRFLVVFEFWRSNDKNIDATLPESYRANSLSNFHVLVSLREGSRSGFVEFCGSGGIRSSFGYDVEILDLQTGKTIVEREFNGPIPSEQCSNGARIKGPRPNLFEIYEWVANYIQ